MQIAPASNDASKHLLPREIDLRPTHYQRRLLGTRLHDQQRVCNCLFAQGFNGEGSNPLAALRLANRIGSCCRNTIIGTKDDGSLRVVEMRCKSRLCPICSRRRASAVFCRTVEAIRKMNSPRLMTLTLAHGDSSLRTQCLRLRQCFAELRRSGAWKKHVTGGIYCMEITRNKTLGQWHPHLHIVCDGDYFPHHLLKSAWLTATGDSTIVHLRKVNDAKATATYVAKYVSKTISPEGLPDEVLLEWIEEVRGLRFIQAFGTLHGAVLDTRDKAPSACPTVTTIGHIEHLAEAAAGPDPEPKQLLQFVLSTRHRRIRDGGPIAPRPTPAGEREIVDRLRAWFSRQEEIRRDIFAAASRSAWSDSVGQRSLGFREDRDAPAAARQLGQAGDVVLTDSR
jgi:replication protein